MEFRGRQALEWESEQARDSLPLPCPSHTWRQSLETHDGLAAQGH